MSQPKTEMPELPRWARWLLVLGVAGVTWWVLTVFFTALFFSFDHVGQAIACRESQRTAGSSLPCETAHERIHVCKRLMETGNGSIGGCKRLMHDSKPFIARGNESLAIPHALISVGKLFTEETNE